MMLFDRYRNISGFCILITIVSVLSCSTINQHPLYDGNYQETGLIKLPAITPAKGFTKSIVEQWVHPGLNQGKKSNNEISMDIKWHSYDENGTVKMDINPEVTLTLKEQNIRSKVLLTRFSCVIDNDGNIKGITASPKEIKSAFEQHVFDDMMKNITKITDYIIPNFDKNIFKSGDVVRTRYLDFNKYQIEELNNIRYALIYRGIGNYDGSEVLVFEADEKIKTDKFIGSQTLCILVDSKSGYIVNTNGKLILIHNNTPVFYINLSASTNIEND